MAAVGPSTIAGNGNSSGNAMTIFSGRSKNQATRREMLIGGASVVATALMPPFDLLSTANPRRTTSSTEHAPWAQ